MPSLSEDERERMLADAWASSAERVAKIEATINEWLPTLKDISQIPELTIGERRELLAAHDALRAVIAKAEGRS